MLFVLHRWSTSGRKGIIVDKRTTTTCLLTWESVSTWIFRARFFSKCTNTTLLHCYVPTKRDTADEKTFFFQINLQGQVDRTPRHKSVMNLTRRLAQTKQDMNPARDKESERGTI